ncbi:MAG: hypothetical protein HC905_04070 [Bacteroidales bacterium]|nr:hypothetical protein [Bacteroidales bacterium]
MNVNSPPDIMIASGRNLAMIYSYSGDKNKAQYYRDFTINMARSRFYPENFINELKNILK